MGWLLIPILSAMLAGCGGSGGVVGSPRLAPGTYRGAENWRTGFLAGVTIPIVAVVLPGNHFAYSDLGAPGGLPYNGAAIFPLAPDAHGAFSARVEQGVFPAGTIPAGVVSGQNRPDAVPQLSGAIRMDTGDEASWSLTRQAGQGHPLEGLYVGTFAGPASGPVILMVGSDGVVILLRGPAGRWDETAVGRADAAAGALSFDNVNPGTALAGAIAGGAASGTYTFAGVGSGTWAAAKQ